MKVIGPFNVFTYGYGLNINKTVILITTNKILTESFCFEERWMLIVQTIDNLWLNCFHVAGILVFGMGQFKDCCGVIF